MARVSDRSDVEYLAAAVPLDVAVLRERYQQEMRSHVGVPEREDLTLELWIEIIQEQQAIPGSEPHVIHSRLSTGAFRVGFVETKLVAGACNRRYLQLWNGAA